MAKRAFDQRGGRSQGGDWQEVWPRRGHGQEEHSQGGGRGYGQGGGWQHGQRAEARGMPMHTRSVHIEMLYKTEATTTRGSAILAGF